MKYDLVLSFCSSEVFWRLSFVVTSPPQSPPWPVLTGACWTMIPPSLAAAGRESEPPLAPARLHFGTTRCRTAMIRRALGVVIQPWRVLVMMRMTKERRLMILTLTHPLGGRAAAWTATRRTLTPSDPVVSYVN